MNIENLTPINEQRIRLLEKVASLYDLPYGDALIRCEKDREDFANWEAGLACFYDFDRHSIGDFAPEPIQELHRTGQHRYLIWLSYTLCRSSNIWFAWCLAHELRHFELNQVKPWLDMTGTFLGETVEHLTPSRIPTEIDANLKARRVTLGLFDEDQVAALMQKHASEGEHSEAFTVLLSMSPHETYDVAAQTLRMLDHYRSGIESVKASSRDSNVACFELDKAVSEIKRYLTDGT